MYRSNWRVSVDQIFSLSLYIFVLYAFLPIIRVFPLPIRMAIRVLPELLMLIVVILRMDVRLWGSYIGIMIFAVVIAIVRSASYANAIEESVLMNCVQSVVYWHTITQGYYVYRYFDANRCKKLFRTIIILVSISAITTILGNIIWPSASRDKLEQYYLYNVGGYAFIYSIAFILPWVLYARQNAGIFPFSKKTLTAIAILLFACVVLSQFMTAAFVSAMALLIVGKGKSISKTTIIVVCLGVVFFLLEDFLWELLNQLGTLAGQWGLVDLAERLKGIYLLAKEGETYGNVLARTHLYKISWNHFLKNPIFGLFATTAFNRSPSLTTTQMLNMSVASVNAVGKHSDIIDLLGAGGLVAFVPFVMVICNFFKRFNKHVINPSLKHVFFVVFCQYIVYGIFDHAFSCFDVALAVFLLSMIARKIKNEADINAAKNKEEHA